MFYLRATSASIEQLPKVGVPIEPHDIPGETILPAVHLVPADGLSDVRGCDVPAGLGSPPLTDLSLRHQFLAQDLDRVVLSVFSKLRQQLVDTICDSRCGSRLQWNVVAVADDLGGDFVSQLQADCQEVGLGHLFPGLKPLGCSRVNLPNILEVRLGQRFRHVLVNIDVLLKKFRKPRLTIQPPTNGRQCPKFQVLEPHHNQSLSIAVQQDISVQEIVETFFVRFLGTDAFEDRVFGPHNTSLFQTEGPQILRHGHQVGPTPQRTIRHSERSPYFRHGSHFGVPSDDWQGHWNAARTQESLLQPVQPTPQTTYLRVRHLITEPHITLVRPKTLAGFLVTHQRLRISLPIELQSLDNTVDRILVDVKAKLGRAT